MKQQRNTTHGLRGKALGALLGTLGVWLAAPLHAQTSSPVEVAHLLAADGGFGLFGNTVSVDGDTALIWRPNDPGSCSGASYVFQRSGATWTQQIKLLPDAGAGCETFGYGLSINADTLSIGARAAQDGGGVDTGAAYIFTRNAGTWTRQTKLFPSGAGSGAFFGSSISISGDTALIGAPRDNGNFSGSAFVFTRSAGVWTQQAKITPSDGASFDQFGSAVSLDGDTALIAAFVDADNGPVAGSAYIFTRNAGVWTQQAKLLASDGTANDEFGNSVSISGDSAVIGAFKHAENGVGFSGAAYVFARSAGVWSEQAKLLPSDAAMDDVFGKSVSISGDNVVVGASGHDDLGSGSGVAYLFNRSAGVWTEQAKLFASDGRPSDTFGFSVSISDNIVIVGATLHNDNSAASGAVYVYDILGGPGTAVCFGDGTGIACPCGNTGGSGEGCLNSAGTGATLDASGSAVVATGDVVLRVSRASFNRVGMFLQGSLEVANPVLGGILCVGGSTRRLEIVQTNATGHALSSQSIVSAGQVSPGQTRLYQFWYRDVSASCAAGSNLSGAYRIVWQ